MVVMLGYHTIKILSNKKTAAPRRKGGGLRKCKSDGENMIYYNWIKIII